MIAKLQRILLFFCVAMTLVAGVTVGVTSVSVPAIAGSGDK